MMVPLVTRIIPQFNKILTIICFFLYSKVRQKIFIPIPSTNTKTFDITDTYEYWSQQMLQIHIVGLTYGFVIFTKFKTLLRVFAVLKSGLKLNWL